MQHGKASHTHKSIRLFLDFLIENLKVIKNHSLNLL
jgi:hypothetical protein